MDRVIPSITAENRLGPEKSVMAHLHYHKYVLFLEIMRRGKHALCSLKWEIG
jgi:hypothetical protein